MSRKWERMVQKNQRSKQGYSQPGSNRPGAQWGRGGLATGDPNRFEGRNRFMPILLLAIAVMLVVFQWKTASDDPLFWATVISYLLLALFFYRRKVFLEVGRNELMTRRFLGFKIVTPDKIKGIDIYSHSVVVRVRGWGGNWNFSRVQQFDVDNMKLKLREFAERNQIPLVER